MLTVKLIVAECVCPPPVPLTITLYVPTGVVAPTEIVRVEDPEPGAAIAVGLKFAAAPDGNPEAESEIEELKSPNRLETIVDDPAPPWGIVKDDAEEDNEKFGPKIMSMIG